MSDTPSETDRLVSLAADGDASARLKLLAQHRRRLQRMVTVRMDRRLAARFDPSDVVQDVLAEANRELSDYLRQQPVPFYPWLRQMAWDRLVDLHRKHVEAGKRSVTKEVSASMGLSDESAIALADRLFDRGSSPSAHAVRQETRDRVRLAISQLPERDREILILRHLEQLSTNQTASVLGINDAAVKARHVRAVERLDRLLRAEQEERS